LNQKKTSWLFLKSTARKFLCDGGRRRQSGEKKCHYWFENKDLIEITSGLNENDLVIVEGNFGLPDGNPVEIQNEVAR